VLAHLARCTGSVLGAGPTTGDLAREFQCPWRLVGDVLRELEAAGEIVRGAREGWQVAP
jgi:DNA-binding GntR family transcriptional regulator